MHRSRIAVILIDHPPSSFDAAVPFWAAAVGGSPTVDPDSPEYTAVGRLDSLTLDLQRLGPGTAARVHLDIETDDVTAEVSRLEGLGAQVRERRDGYTIMADPGGVVFCVVPIQTGDAFAEHATTWE